MIPINPLNPMSAVTNTISAARKIGQYFRKNRAFDPSNPESSRYEPVAEPPQIYAPAPTNNPAPTPAPKPITPVAPPPITTAAAVPPAGPKMATVVNSATGERRAVAVDSPEAKAAFAQGFTLEGANTPIQQAPGDATGQAEASSDVPTDLETSTTTTDYAEIARQAASAGMTFDQYNEFLKSSSAGLSETDREKVLSDLGIPDLVDDYYGKPSLDTQKLYSEKYEETGLKSVKDSIAKLDADIAAVNEQYATAFAEHNNNPFLSAGTRDFRIRTATELKNQQIANLNNQRQSYIDIYDRGLDELDKYITRESTKFEGGRAMTADKLNYLFNEANRLITGQETQKEKEMLRYVPEFLKETAERKNTIDPLEMYKRELEIAKLEKDVFGGTAVPGQKVVLDRKESAALNKEITQSDDYKSLQKSQDSLSALEAYAKLVEDNGFETYGAERQRMEAAYNTAILQLKEFFNLGVLNGPDEAILKEQLPAAFGGVVENLERGITRGGIDGVKASINDMKARIGEKLGRNYYQLLTSYTDYDPEQLTNLKSAERLYDGFIQENADMLLEQMVKNDPQTLQTITSLREQEGLEPYEIYKFIQEEQVGFNGASTSALNGSDLKNGPAALSRVGSGTITGIDGSSAWKWGLDFVLDGGKGADVPSPYSGKVVAASPNGGFGNQVKIELENGEQIWISHLDAVNVKPGQRIAKGDVIGKQGNSGTVLGGQGEQLTATQRASGRGTHLDITIKKKDGSYYTPREVASRLS